MVSPSQDPTVPMSALLDITCVCTIYRNADVDRVNSQEMAVSTVSISR